MKLWPVVTGVAIALTLVACKSPTPTEGRAAHFRF